MKRAIVHHNPPTFDPAVWLARRHRISPATARLLVELGGMGKRHCEPDAFKVGGAAR